MSRSRQRHHGDLEEYAECMRDILTSEPRNGLPSQPTRLLDYVYIGCQAHAESLKTLERFKITHVLNCAGYKGPRPGPNASPYIGIDIEYKEFQAEDSEDYDISQHFYDASKYLDSIRRKGGVALVHCQLGVNRSGAVCVAYLMHAERLTLLEATRLIKAKRSLVLSNRGFHMRLVRFAHSRGLLDPHVESHRSRIEREQAEEDAKLKQQFMDWNPNLGHSKHHVSLRQMNDGVRNCKLPITSSSRYISSSCDGDKPQYMPLHTYLTSPRDTGSQRHMSAARTCMTSSRTGGYDDLTRSRSRIRARPESSDHNRSCSERRPSNDLLQSMYDTVLNRTVRGSFS